MKKKLVSILLSVTLVCSSGITIFANEKDDRIAELEAQVEEMQKTINDLTQKLKESNSAQKSPTQEPAENSNGINFSTDDFTISYIKHEFGTDYEGNKCLLYYYNFTNTSDENVTAGLTTNVQCFQDGSECEMAITEERNDSMDNYAMNEVQPGGTVEVCQPFTLKSENEITIEASELFSMKNDKATQTIAVQ